MSGPIGGRTPNTSQGPGPGIVSVAPNLVFNKCFNGVKFNDDPGIPIWDRLLGDAVFNKYPEMITTGYEQYLTSKLMHEVRGLDRQVRQALWYVDPPCSCPYHYANIVSPANPLTMFLKELGISVAKHLSAKILPTWIIGANVKFLMDDMVSDGILATSL